ncbi:MAG: hypothetical protein IV092_05835 [Burkholderiaceae bacterium]|nr:hypothetical protein [Burkholderiaceae bacterium]
MSKTKLHAAWLELRAQWTANARLRMGGMVMVAIVWVYGLLLGSDQADAWRIAAEGLRGEISRVQPLAKEQGWPQRAEDARQQLAAIRAMLWTETELGLVEARFQDWLRSTAVKSGLVVRDIAVLRAVPTSPTEGITATPGPQVIKARVVFDQNRVSLVGFLAELGRSEKVVVVDRMALRLSSQPALVEMDLHILGVAQMAPTEQGAKP